MPDCSKADLIAMSNCLNIRQDLLTRISNLLNDTSYREAMENSSLYNNRLVGERQMRLPFLDAQTGVAQADCYLWMNRWERMPGKFEGQLYTYPARKWRKKRRQYLINETYLTRKTRENETNEIESNSSGSNIAGNSSSHHTHPPAGVNANNVTGASDSGVKLETTDNSNDKYFDVTKEGWYGDFDDGSDLPDAGELDDPESDYDDYEEYPNRRKRKKRESQKRKRVQSSSAANQQQQQQQQQQPQQPQQQQQPSSTNMPTLQPSTQPMSHTQTSLNVATRGSNVSDEKEVTRSSSGKPTISNYCDFCLGDSVENKKTKAAEELVSCSDCGRSAHPTCLQFTPNMTMSVKKYRWQCIECKSCGLCGTSDNDDQLLFCDDCDRGYHMYCLRPPLSEPPEGSWSCHLCIEEYHTPKK